MYGGGGGVSSIGKIPHCNLKSQLPSGTSPRASILLSGTSLGLVSIIDVWD